MNARTIIISSSTLEGKPKISIDGIKFDTIKTLIPQFQMPNAVKYDSENSLATNPLILQNNARMKVSKGLHIFNFKSNHTHQHSANVGATTSFNILLKAEIYIKQFLNGKLVNPTDPNDPNCNTAPLEIPVYTKLLNESIDFNFETTTEEDNIELLIEMKMFLGDNKNEKFLDQKVPSASTNERITLKDCYLKYEYRP